MPPEKSFNLGSFLLEAAGDSLHLAEYEGRVTRLLQTNTLFLDRDAFLRLDDAVLELLDAAVETAIVTGYRMGIHGRWHS